MTSRLLLTVSFILFLPGIVTAQDRATNVGATKHNLTSSGPGEVKVGGASDVCVFCHTPHASNPQAPLWNRQDPGTWYQTYDSSTLKATVGQPTGSSRLCLSCHDGTIALTQTWNANNASAGLTVFIAPTDAGYIGTDLSDDHPISFHFSSAVATAKGNLIDPATLPAQLPLDHNGQMQCTTCHEPHDGTYGNFLRMDNTQSQMCIACHQYESWSQSSHATSTASLASATRDAWSNLDGAAMVKDAACESCHRPHTAGGRQRLLRHLPEENNCFSCHDASVAQSDLTTMMTAISSHNVSLTTGIHDPTENGLTMAQHVECADCHNPHQAATGAAASAPDIQPAMSGASGMTDTGTMIARADYEYQVCYKCHSKQNFAQSVVDRHDGGDDIAEEFQSTNPSYHPVVSQGKNTNVPSLLQPLNTTSMLYCTDCHGSDNPTGPQGPHASMHKPLLVDAYTTTDFTPESPAAYALCYKCHNRSSILADQSFSTHKLHIADHNTPCSVCHDPHGISGSNNNTNLINFDRAVVAPAASGQGPTFNDTGLYQGNCTLNCHGKDHQDLSYP